MSQNQGLIKKFSMSCWCDELLVSDASVQKAGMAAMATKTHFYLVYEPGEVKYPLSGECVTLLIKNDFI